MNGTIPITAEFQIRQCGPGDSMNFVLGGWWDNPVRMMDNSERIWITVGGMVDNSEWIMDNSERIFCRELGETLHEGRRSQANYINQGKLFNI